MRSSWESERVDGFIPCWRRRVFRAWVWAWFVGVGWVGGATWAEWW